MKLVYIDDAAEFEDFMGKVVGNLQQIAEEQIGYPERIEYIFQRPDGSNEDFIYFGANGEPICNDVLRLPVDAGVFPKMLLRQSTVERYLKEKDCFYLLDIDFARFYSVPVPELADYGLMLAKYLHHRGVPRECIFLFTAYPDVAVRQGKYTNPLSWFDRHDKQLFAIPGTDETLAARLAHNFIKHAINTQPQYIVDPDLKVLQEKYGLVGSSAYLLNALRRATQVAPTNATVLIRGESGTGKELIASLIQGESARAKKPFIKVNCAALPESLVESELFGHERGAFTGAHTQQKGRFESANGGTIFLDEIGKLELAAQAKLLRVLQEHQFERLGSSATMNVDVRVIAATNTDLERAVRENKFLHDLYFRLNVFPIYLPPLRNHLEDISQLSSHLLKIYAREHSKKTIGFSPAALKVLTNHQWPGNVRELANVIESTVIISSSTQRQIGENVLLEAMANLSSPGGNLSLPESPSDNLAVPDLISANRWKDLVNRVKGQGTFFPSFKKLIEQNTYDERARELVWEVITTMLYSVCENRLQLKNDHPMRITAVFVDSLNLNEESDAQIVSSLLTPLRRINPSISWRELNLSEFDDQLGGSKPRDSRLNEHRTLLKTLIKRQLGL